MQTSIIYRKGSNRRAFTLIELLVVVALIALLVTVMVPVILGFMKGRGLGMMGNNIAGFLAYARTESMNRREPHVLVYYFENESIPTGGMFERRAGPGMVLFRVNTNPRPGEPTVVFVRQLEFAGGIGSTVDFASSWKAQASTGPIQGALTQHQLDRVNEAFQGKYKILITPDGRLAIPGDKPGWILDTEETRGLDTQVDLVLTDGNRFLFMDINGATGAVKRSRIIPQQDTDATP
jgi:prepilin-type N-terminal cleavage/methylation domain-containing protein